MLCDVRKRRCIFCNCGIGTIMLCAVRIGKFILCDDGTGSFVLWKFDFISSIGHTPVHKVREGGRGGDIFT